MRRWFVLVPLILMPLIAVPVARVLLSDKSEGPSVAGCDRVVAAGASIQSALRIEHPGATICVSGGTYAVRAELRPKTGQTIKGIGSPSPTLRCGAVFCLDGATGPSGVILQSLVLEGAKDANVRLGDGWVARRIESRDAKVGGILVRGTGASIDSSYVHHNGAFGIRAVDAKHLTIEKTEVAFNGTDPNVPAGYAGGVKLNAVDGLAMQGNNVHDNGGGAGIWLDINSRHFVVTGNRSADNAGDGIRAEISCFGSLENNTVSGSPDVGIDIFNAHDVTLTSNTVSAPAGAGFGIRMLSNGRTSAPGDGSCMSGGIYQNADNRATSNVITLADPSTRTGVEDSGGVSSGNAWTSNRYTVPNCAAPVWQWWDGAASRLVSFPAWQALGQDVAGSCG
jgi:parallel beta-helix repeat protein